jgi:hypothetical protein
MESGFVFVLFVLCVWHIAVDSFIDWLRALSIWCLGGWISVPSGSQNES